MKIAVLGAGSFGTALAVHVADLGHDVKLWAHRAEHAETMRRTNANTPYLAAREFPANLAPTSILEEALEDASFAISAVPAQTTRSVWTHARAHLPVAAPIVCVSKGIETGTLALMSDVFEAVVPGHPTGFVGGPSFAAEVSAHQPTAVVLASRDAAVANAAQRMLSCDWLRTYVSTDVVGVELGGALKNVIAIASGCAEGLGLGLNARAALITRGLAEITRLAVELGAEPVTLAGLAGLGDLVLTCTGDLSRNRRVGIELGKGRPLDEILRDMGHVAEGVDTARSANDLALRTGIDMPITHEVVRILFEQKSPREVVRDLMRRTLKAE